MKKVLIAVNYIGFFHFLWDDIDLLNEMGYKVFAVGDNGKSEEHTLSIMRDKNVTFIDLSIDGKQPLTRKNYNYYKRITDIIEQEQFELIHCHTPIVGLLVRIAAYKYYRKNKTKVIYTTHGLAYTKLSTKKEYLIYHSIESFASRLCNAIITINHEDYDNCKKLHCEHVYHINGVGVDIAKYRDVSINRNIYREKLGIPNDKIMILSIGEFSYRKNLQVIVESIATLPNKDEYIYAICGREMTKGGTIELVRKIAKEKGVNVTFLGFRNDIPEIVHCADIGAIPSTREGLGLAGIQQLCAGVPMVGSDIQGIKEYIINNETGYLNNPYDIYGFAEGIKKLSNKKIRESMNSKCLEVVEKFNSEISIKQRRAIYQQIISNNKV